ncbi:tail fiber domain-containing protein [Streptomyces rectiverticillatus]|uniref:tail fiber domain-containing protein n=1 Tax=Streptomyces rectiverticillatus TaxID=173860 RepID=UPI0015C3E551|nr:tail fiber domain-containing protein [Streptomyces rectiverticillatus]QLE70463.1 tail fiber domain-containing protein [Streptomyces rectiverticillatus]
MTCTESQATACVPRLTVNSHAGPGNVAGSDEAVNGFEVLDKVSALPIGTWRYSWESPGIRHLGPMSQDFTAAFGLGRYDTSIDCVDINGVALLAIQALHRLVNELREELESLRSAPQPSSPQEVARQGRD